MDRRTALATMAGFVASDTTAFGQMGHGKPRQPACEEMSLACADTVTPTFGADGRLWLAVRGGDRLFVLRSSDHGTSFLPATPVDTGGMSLDWGPDARPKLIVRPDGVAVLAFATFRDENFNGEVFATRSTDGGASFAPPRPITDVQESQRFQDLALDADGSIFATWLDKRDRVSFKARGLPFPGAGLAYAWSRDGGASFTATKIVVDNTCECCRLAVAFKGPGQPVVLFRNIFPGSVRDHAIIAFSAPDTPGALQRISEDDWRTQACPHQGPSLAIAPDGAFHAVWFTQGENRQGLFYAQSHDEGAHFSTPIPLAQSDKAASRPFVLARGPKLYIAWKEYDGTATQVLLKRSADGGAKWGEATSLARTAKTSDHPVLLSDGRRAYLSWQTADGYRLIDLEAAE